MLPLVAFSKSRLLSAVRANKTVHITVILYREHPLGGSLNICSRISDSKLGIMGIVVQKSFNLTAWHRLKCNSRKCVHIPKPANNSQGNKCDYSMHNYFIVFRMEFDKTRWSCPWKWPKLYTKLCQGVVGV